MSTISRVSAIDTSNSSLKTGSNPTNTSSQNRHRRESDKDEFRRELSEAQRRLTEAVSYTSHTGKQITVDNEGRIIKEEVVPHSERE